MFDRPESPPISFAPTEALTSPPNSITTHDISEIPPTNSSTPPETSHRVEGWRAVGNKAQKAVGFTALTLVVIETPYWVDVEINQQLEHNASVTLNYKGEPLHTDAEDTLSVITDGFNTYDANYLTGTIGPSIQQVSDGYLLSLGNNNAVISRRGIGHAVVQNAEKFEATKVNFTGYSMGGIIALQSAADTITETPYEVPVIMAISSPSSYDTLRPYQQQELGFGKQLFGINGAPHSKLVRTLGNIYFYRDNFTREYGNTWEDVTGNWGSFWNTVGRSFEDAGDPKLTSPNTLYQQIKIIANANIEKEFERIASMRGLKQMPVFVYVGTGNPGYDSVVNDKEAAAAYKAAAEKYGITFIEIRVPGAIHAQYYKTTEEYDETFAELSSPVSEAVQHELDMKAILLGDNWYPESANNGPVIR